mgnify:CR=1 FL=1
MNNADYWKQRFEQLEDAQNALGEKTLGEIEKQYNDTLELLEARILLWYQRLADNNGISLATARTWLESSELREFRWTVKEYIKYGKENALNQKWVKELENASAKYHISKLEALKIQTRQSLEAMYAKQGKTMQKAFSDIYRSGYYHTAYEIQHGINIGWDISGIDQPQIKKVLSKPWAADGYNFSERIWKNKNKLISEVHTSLVQNIQLGADPQKAINDIAAKMKTSKRNAGRLVMTEEAYFSSAAQKDCFVSLGVEEYEIVATLDSHTSKICRTLDKKHFPVKDYQAGVTAPPFHVYCRSTTAPYFDDEFDVPGERAARDKDGNTYYIPADMNYREWEKTFVKDSSGSVDKSGGSGIIRMRSDDVALENQRYGRNKNTVVNKTYIESGEYRRKFDNATDNKKVNKTLYDCSKKALKHRSGTVYEDMYWIDGNTGKILACKTDSTQERAVIYTDDIKNAIKNNNNIITIHTHPSSMPPSIGDFNSAFRNGYNKGVVACHDGKIFIYSSGQKIENRLYDMYIQGYISEGLSEYEAQIRTLEKLKLNYAIDFKEVF